MKNRGQKWAETFQLFFCKLNDKFNFRLNERKKTLMTYSTRAAAR